MRPFLSLLLAAIMLNGCATAGASYSTQIFSPLEVLANTKELEGKEIVVRGWVGGCQPDDNRVCGLYPSKRKAIDPKPLEWPLPFRGHDSSVSMDVRQVMLRGVYVVTCQSDELKICLEYDGYFQINSIEDL